MAFESIALLTTEAKRRTAEMWATGKSFQVKYFALSAGGHNEDDATIAEAIDPSATELPGLPVFGPEPIDGVEWSADFCPTFVCKVLPGELVGSVSSLGLYAEIVYVPVGDSDVVGTRFLFAVHNRPLVTLTGSDSAEFRVSVFM